jgi:cell division protein FtsB
MRRPSTAAPAARVYPTQGSAALAVEDLPAPPARARRQGPAHLAVAPPPPVAVPRAPFVVLVLLVVIGGVLGILLLNTKVNENAFILHDLRQEQAVLDQRQQELEERVAQADSPARLAEAARRMGLVRAEQLGYLRLPEGVVVFEGPPPTGVGPPDSGSEG